MRRASRVVLASVLAALVGVTGCAAGLLAGYPRLREMRDASDLEPGLLQVDPVARGDVALGDGVYAVLGAGGLTITRRDATVWRSVDRGSLVTAGIGHLDWRGDDGHGGVLRAREVIDQKLANMRITGRSHDGNRLQYTGRLFDGDPQGTSSRPLTVTITRRSTDSRVILDVDVPGTDVVAIHEFRQAGYTYRGFGEQFAEPVVRDGRWPVVARAQGVGRGEQPLTVVQDLLPGGHLGGAARGGDAATTPAPMPFYLASTMTGVGLDANAYAVVDLSHGGRIDLSVWSSRLRARLYDGADPDDLVAAHSADVGRVRPAPGWATSGAIVGVRGSSQRVRTAVSELQAAGALIAAVLVRDGGPGERYPDWASLVADLRARGVRVMTTVSPSLTDPTLLAKARSNGWLVTHEGGAPTSLVDLTNAAAFDWYATVLADRMRSEGVVGWLAQNGENLPMDARVSTGSVASAHNAWPRRWAQLTRTACERAGNSDCLVLQDSADEGTPASAGIFNQGRQVSDWSEQDGLASVLRGKLSGGLSGMAMLSSGVGGWSAPSVPLWPDPHRSDELLARWAELEAFGSLLRSEDGAHPASMPQVWDSPARRKAFARATKLYAATDTYRRRVMLAAAQTGLPVVRPFWLENADARQANTGDEYFFGDSLLVVPALHEGQREVQAVLPAGKWVELFSGKVYSGPKASTPGPVKTKQGGDAAKQQQKQDDEPPAPPGQGPNATPPPNPISVTVPAPLGHPVVLFRQGDPQGQALRQVLLKADLLR